MTTRVGSGASSNRDTEHAVTEAIERALRQLGAVKPTFGFLFAGPDHLLNVAQQRARSLVPGLDLVSSSSAGELTADGLIHGGVAVLLVASDAMTQGVAFASGLGTRPQESATRLCEGLADARKAALRFGHKQLTTLLLADGLAGTGELLVNELLNLIPAGSQIVGGAAGDEARFHQTFVGAGDVAAIDSAAALHVFSPTRWGIGVNHGLRPTTKKLRVTKATDNVVFELDGAPAFEAYREHAHERGVTLSPATAGPYLIGNELGIHFFDNITRVRAPLSVGADGSLSCAAAIPEGAMVCILDGEPASMIRAARSAAEEARERLGDIKPAGILLFDCVCRGMILKDSFQDEIEAVRSVFGGDVPIAGFLTYGEIARYTGRLGGWHNATAVVAAIPAV